MTTSKTPRPRIHRADHLYHEQLAALMRAIHTQRYGVQKIYGYGAVSHLRLLDEGKVRGTGDEAEQRDLAVLREALRLHAKLQEDGGAA